MPTPPLSREEVLGTLKKIAGYASNPRYYCDKSERRHGQKSAICALAEDTGMDRHYINRCINRAKTWGIMYSDMIEPEIIPQEGDHLPNGREVLERAKLANLEAKRVRLAGHNFRKVLVNKGPFAVGLIGDPHLDSPGTNLDQLERDMKLFAAAGVRCINVGDLLDNWPTGGRLAKKLQDSKMSRTESLGLARWFILESGVRFDCHVLGNHDEWAGHDYSTLLHSWAAQAKSRLVYWGANVQYVHEDFSFTLQAHHDFPGHSMYNSLHALMRRAREEGLCDLYVAGHRHTAAQGSEESGFRNKHYKYLRVKGYKEGDEYAFAKGFPQQKEGASAIAVINPYAETMEGRCRTFLDLTDGLDWLETLKSRLS